MREPIVTNDDIATVHLLVSNYIAAVESKGQYLNKGDQRVVDLGNKLAKKLSKVRESTKGLAYADVDRCLQLIADYPSSRKAYTDSFGCPPEDEDEELWRHLPDAIKHLTRLQSVLPDEKDVASER